MENKDLKTGWILEHKDGTLGIVLLDTPSGDKVVGETWYPIDSYDNIFDDVVMHNPITKVYAPRCNASYFSGGKLNKNNGTLIWQRTTKREIYHPLTGNKIEISEESYQNIKKDF